MTVASKSVFRRLNIQMPPDELAHFLSKTIDPNVLRQALSIATALIEPVDIWVDGWCKYNGTSKALAGWTIAVYIDGKVDHRVEGVVPYHEQQTNNVAEYHAFINGLHYGKQYRRPIIIHTDSQLVIGQVVDAWKVNSDHLRPLVEEARTLVMKAGAEVVKEPRERIVEIVGH